ncbi:alpha-methylacyl-CoA racemase isoform X2 [Bacillus rossius redtenbacheri]
MALKGIQVIELGGLAPAPFCGMILADFGATVIRVTKIGERLGMDSLANGKKILALNLKSQKGQDVLCQLSKVSDVLIEPFRPGVMEKLGLGPSTLLEKNPRLIYSRLTGFGQSGYYSRAAGHDINYVAVSGLLSLLGRKGSKPTAPVNLIADFGGGGLMCAFGIVAALLERTSSGRGQVVDANMVEGSAYLGSWLFRSQKLPFWGQPRGSNILDTGAHFYDTYETKDGKYMAVGAIEPQFYSALLKGLDLPENTPNWADFEGGKETFARRFLEKTQEEWCRVFDGTDACVTPVLALPEAAEHPHNAGRRAFLECEDGSVAPAAAPRLSRSPAASLASLPLPRQAQHTAQILRSLGYPDPEITQLEEEGVIETVTPLSKY